MNDAPAPATLSDPDTWLDQHGDSLYRFALQRVREPSTAVRSGSARLTAPELT